MQYRTSMNSLFRNKKTHVSIIQAGLPILLAVISVGCQSPYSYTKRIKVKHDRETRWHTLTVTSEPSGAKVFVEEKQEGVTPCKLTLPYTEVVVGHRKVRVEGTRYPDGKRIDMRETHYPEVDESSTIEERTVTITWFKDGYRKTSRIVTIPKQSNVNAFLPASQTPPPKQQQQQQQQQTVVITPGVGGSSVSVTPGSTSSQSIFCSKCGRKNTSDNSYCSKCGKKLSSMKE